MAPLVFSGTKETFTLRFSIVIKRNMTSFYDIHQKAHELLIKDISALMLVPPQVGRNHVSRHNDSLFSVGETKVELSEVD